MKHKEINLDIGAGSGKSLIERAKENPDQYFIGVEPSMARGFSSETYPSNILWVKGKASCKEPLPIKSASVNEVNIDFAFVFLYGAEENTNSFREGALKMIKEGLRVLKPDSSLLIREPQYMLGELIPIMTEAGIKFSFAPIPLEKAMEHSNSGREFAQEAKFGDKESHPYLIWITKDGSF